jgi:hypothetical protein
VRGNLIEKAEIASSRRAGFAMTILYIGIWAGLFP